MNQRIRFPVDTDDRQSSPLCVYQMRDISDPAAEIEDSAAVGDVLCDEGGENIELFAAGRVSLNRIVQWILLNFGGYVQALVGIIVVGKSAKIYNNLYYFDSIAVASFST